MKYLIAESKDKKIFENFGLYCVEFENKILVSEEKIANFKNFFIENEKIDRLEDFIKSEFYIEFINEDDYISTKKEEADKIFEQQKDNIVAYYRIDWINDISYKEEYFYEDEVITLHCLNKNEEGYFYKKEIENGFKKCPICGEILKK